MASKIIKNIKVKHSGEFIVDTVPPNGNVLINGGDNFTKSATVSLQLDANDETTDVKNMDIRNVDITGSGDIVVGDFVENIPFSTETFWNLTETEGFKVVQVKFRDYADNVTEFISNSTVRKLYVIDGDVVDAELVNGIVYSATMSSVYSYDSFNVFVGSLEGEIVDLQENSGSLYVAVNDNEPDSSQVFVLLDGEFVSVNSFDSFIVDMASYNGELYVVLENGEFYKKDSSAWFLVAVFNEDVAYIDGESNYLYIVFSDLINGSLYNGDNFVDFEMIDPNLEVSEDESSSDSSSSDSSSSTDLESSISTEESSSSSINESTSSQTISTSSDSSILQNSSSSSSSDSSLSLESSSSQEFIGGPETTSSEDIISESSSSTVLGETSSSSTVLGETSSSSNSSSLSESSFSSDESSSSGDPCFCEKYLEDSLYVKNFRIENMSDKYGLGCNLYGRMVILDGTFARVYLYHSEERVYENEVARSIDFEWQYYPLEDLPLISSPFTNVTGKFDYIYGYDRTNNLPHEFTVVCVEAEAVDDSSSSDISNDSESLDLMIGNGTEESPYRIRTCRDLQLVRQDPEAYYVLENDIDCIESTGGIGFLASDLDSFAVNFDSRGFDPIGTLVAPWKGNFDGQCYSIYNVFINRPSEDYVGLFGYTDGGVIKNLSFKNFQITGRNDVGGLVGYSQYTIIENIDAIVGIEDESEAVIPTVTGSQRVGGLIGSLLIGSLLENSYSRVFGVTGNDIVGGLVGYRQTKASIINCYSTEALSSFGIIGGLVGQSGGAGPSGSVSNGEVVSSYWDVENSGIEDSADGDGRATIDMKSVENYAGWDFEEVWAINSLNDGYPNLICNAENDQSSSSSESSSSNDPQSFGSEESDGLSGTSDGFSDGDNSSSQSDGVGIMSRYASCEIVALYENCNLVATELAEVSVKRNAIYTLCPNQGIN